MTYRARCLGKKNRRHVEPLVSYNEYLKSQLPDARIEYVVLPGWFSMIKTDNSWLP